jgi:hypothetical protein
MLEGSKPTAASSTTSRSSRIANVRYPSEQTPIKYSPRNKTSTSYYSLKVTSAKKINGDSKSKLSNLPNSSRLSEELNDFFLFMTEPNLQNQEEVIRTVTAKV